MPRALLSVSDKTGIVEVARGLAARGFELVSTGGTAGALAEAGLAVTSVSDLTGFPEMLEGRVKTLHPAVHGGILARRDHPQDLRAIAQHGIQPIDVVIVNLYPFAETAKKPGVGFDELVEQIDIGGPSLVRAAAKNFRDVLVVVDPGDYPTLLEALDETPRLAFRYELMRKALAHTGAYDTAISATLATIDLNGDTFERRGTGHDGLGTRLDLVLTKIRDLRYGENPHQRAAWYRPSDVGSSDVGSGRSDVGSGFSRIAETAGGFGDATILQGKELSYTNLLDLDAAARIVLDFSEPAAAVIKHTNPCGVASGATAVQAYVRARDTDRLSSFGGIVAVNRPIDVAAAEAITETKIDAVIAPGVEEAARQILGRKGAMRVVTARFGDSDLPLVEWRAILGATLAQERDRVAEAGAPWVPGALPDGFRFEDAAAA